MRAEGAILSGVFAVVAALIGVFSLGLTGLVWYQGELRETTSFDPTEASIGYGGLMVFWAIAGVLLIVAVVLSVRRAIQEPKHRKAYVAIAVLVPVAVLGLTAGGWLILLNPSGASFGA